MRQVRLHQHTPHPHRSLNANAIHSSEQRLEGVNTRIAVFLTRNVGTMWCAYIFAGIGIGGIVGAVTQNIILGLIFGSISSYFLQLVLLPVIMVGQNVLNRKQEIQSDEAFKTTMNTYHDIEQIMTHLDAQDRAILEIVRKLEARSND